MVRVEDALLVLDMKQKTDGGTYDKVHVIGVDDVCSKEVIPAISGTGDVGG